MMKSKKAPLLPLVLPIFFLALLFPLRSLLADDATAYPVHSGVTATVFWVGEIWNKDNKGIHNWASAWDPNWFWHFGGWDDPGHRRGYYPLWFTPNENPFYFALPYNDLQESGRRKPKSLSIIPWATSEADEWSSILKNRWIRIRYHGRDAYAQWEDVGPFQDNDAAYVFGDAQPEGAKRGEAGLDLSPAVRDYLKFPDSGQVDWQFVAEKDVPAGPWKKRITRRK